MLTHFNAGSDSGVPACSASLSQRSTPNMSLISCIGLYQLKPSPAAPRRCAAPSYCSASSRWFTYYTLTNAQLSHFILKSSINNVSFAFPDLKSAHPGFSKLLHVPFLMTILFLVCNGNIVLFTIRLILHRNYWGSDLDIELLLQKLRKILPGLTVSATAEQDFYFPRCYSTS